MHKKSRLARFYCVVNLQAHDLVLRDAYASEVRIVYLA